MACALWRKRNLPTLRIAKLAQERMAQIHSAIASGVAEDPASDQSNQVERTFIEKCRAAEEQARQELGELYALTAHSGLSGTALPVSDYNQSLVGSGKTL